MRRRRGTRSSSNLDESQHDFRCDQRAKGYRIGVVNSALPSICNAEWLPGTSQYKSHCLVESTNPQSRILGSMETPIGAWPSTGSIGIKFSNRSYWRVRFT